MIGWSIDAAVSSSLFEHVIVSTDDEEVRDLAIELGADVPFVRPAELADDHAVLNAVMAHAVQWCDQNLPEIQYACCLLATAPFVTKTDLSEGLARMKKSDAAFAVSICRYNFPVQRSVRVSGDGRLEMLHPEHLYTRSQDLEDIFHDAGQFYWGTKTAWIEKKPLFDDQSTSVVIENSRVQDIDTLEDWSKAELMFKAFTSRLAR